MELNEAVERYVAAAPRYKRAARQVGRHLEEIARGIGVPCSVSAREKDPRSYLAKVVTKGYADAWGMVTDKAGARVIVERPSDVDRLVDALRAAGVLPVLRVEDKRNVLSPQQLGYSGVHAQVQAPVEPDDTEPIECEVQLRTAAQDVWSVVSHSLLYKPVVDLPPAEQHAIYRLVALVELFDLEVERVMDALPNQAGYEYSDMLQAIETDFIEIAHQRSHRDLSLFVLTALGGAIPNDKQYADTVHRYVDEHRAVLRGIYERYGPKSSMSTVPQYTLFGQAESLALLERLESDPYALLDAWNSAGLPEDWLRTVASVSEARIEFD